MDVAGGAALKTGYCVMPNGIGAQFTDGKTVPHLPDGRPVNPMIPMILARHSLWETTTLFRNILAFWNDNHYNITGIPKQ